MWSYSLSILDYILLSCTMLCCSVVPDFVTPWTVAHQAPLSMGFSRQEYWSGLPCPPSGDLPNPGIESRSPYCRWILYYLNHQGGTPFIILSYIVTDPFYFLYFTGFWIVLKNPESFSFPLVEEIRVQCLDPLLSKLRYRTRQVLLLGKHLKEGFLLLLSYFRSLQSCQRALPGDSTSPEAFQICLYLISH